MSELRVGLIGCGGMGAHLARQCRTLEDAKITAVCDIADDRAKALADEFGATEHPSYRSLLNADVDAVIIATPNDLHAPMTITAAKKGKHIFCEKPMALTVRDCDRMIAAAEEAGVKLMVGQVLRLFPVFWKSKQIADSGELGTPFGMSVRRLGGPFSGKSWRSSKEQCGGVIYEVHVHELDFMRYILGEAKSVYASTGRFTDSGVEYEDVAFIHVNYSSGAIGTLHCGISSSIGQYDMTIQCENGTLVNGGFGGPITHSRFGEDAVTIRGADIVKEEPYREEVRSWVESITKGTPMIFDGRDGRSAIELAQAAYRSAKTGKVVELPLRR